MSILDNLPHTCTAYRRVTTSDEYGGASNTETTLFTDRPCWQQWDKDRQVDWEYDKDHMRMRARLYFTSDPELCEQDEVLVTGKLPDGTAIDPVRWEVISRAQPDATAGLSILFRVLIEYKTGDQP